MNACSLGIKPGWRPPPPPVSHRHVSPDTRPQTPDIMLALLLVCVSPLLVTAEVEQPAEISDEELKSINKANDLSLK